jgi:hypothetical protein
LWMLRKLQDLFWKLQNLFRKLHFFSKYSNVLFTLKLTLNTSKQSFRQISNHCESFKMFRKLWNPSESCRNVSGSIKSTENPPQTASLQLSHIPFSQVQSPPQSHLILVSHRFISWKSKVSPHNLRSSQ